MDFPRALWPNILSYCDGETLTKARKLNYELAYTLVPVSPVFKEWFSNQLALVIAWNNFHRSRMGAFSAFRGVDREKATEGFVRTNKRKQEMFYMSNSLKEPRMYIE